MAGEGRIIARASVRIVPDSSGFRAAAERDIEGLPDGKVEIVAEFNDKEAKAELARLASEGIHIEATVDLEKGALAAEKALAEKPVKVPVNFDVDKGALEAEKLLAKKPIKVPVNFDVDRDPFKDMLRGIGRDLVNPVKSAFSSIQSIGGQAFSGIGEEVSQLSGSLEGLGGPITSAVAGVAKLAAGGLLVAEAGAAVSAAWGAASTAIAAVPAAIGLIGAPIAAIALGMDGIKAAAKTIQPQFDAMQKSISAAFQQGLTPVLQNLANNLFPKLSVGLAATATALSGVAANTVNWLTSTPGIQLLSATVGNVNAAITAMSPGILAATQGFLSLASNNAAMHLLSTAVNDVGAALKSISENTSLTSAFQGLEGVLSSLTQGFTNLVNNGIKLFASAAPGIQSAIDAINGFFSGFDYAALGSAVGGAFTGIANAIKQIDPGTVQAIQGAFEHLGQVLSGPTVSNAFRVIADQIPGFVNALADAADGLADIVGKVDAFFDALTATDHGTFKAAVDRFFSDAPTTVANHMKDADAAAKTGVNNLGNTAQAGGQALHDRFIGPVAKLPADVQTPLGQTAANAGTGGTATAQAFQAGLTQLGAAVTQVFGPVVGAAITAGLNQLGPIITAGFGVVTTAFTTAFSTLATGAVPLGFIGIGAAFTAGLAGIATQITTTFGTNLSLAVGTGMLQLQNAVTIGLVGVQTAFTTGLGLVATGVTTFFSTTLSVAVGTGMLAVRNAVVLGMAGVATAFTTGFANVNTAVSGAMVNVAGAFTTGFANVNAAVTTGMGNALTAVNQGMANLTTAVQTGGTDLVTAMTTTMTNFARAITDGQTAAVGAIKTVVAAVVKAVDVNALVSVGAQLDQGLANGMIQNSKVVQDAARKVVQDAKAAAQAEANINSPSRLFRDEIGKPLTEGVAVGQLAEIRMVEDASRQVVQAAVAAAQREIDGVGALELSTAFTDTFGSLSTQVNAAISTDAGKPPAIVATIPVMVDGKVVDRRVEIVVAEWEKEILAGQRGA